MAKHNPLTLKMAINLAAPHTWPAAIMPTLVALCVASNSTPLSVTMSLTLLVIVTLMQSAVNTFNDYYDFVKGSDSADDYVDPSDAVLVYNDVDPKAALKLAIAMLVCAFALGIYAIVKAGFVPLVIALIGALFVVLYSPDHHRCRLDHVHEQHVRHRARRPFGQEDVACTAWT